MTPTQQILTHLKTHGSITWHEAEKKYGIKNLPTIINNLRSSGKIKISEKTEYGKRITFNPNGEKLKPVTRYHLIKED